MHSSCFTNTAYLLQKAIVQDDIFTASTQTAIVLAELAVDSHNEEVVSQSPIDLNATGFLVDEEMLRLDVSNHVDIL